MSVSEENTNTDKYKGDKLLTHGAIVIKYMLLPWDGTNWTVFVESYFALVKSAVVLKKLRLRFIDVVSTDSNEFPMSYFS